MAYYTNYSLSLHNCTDTEVKAFADELYEKCGHDENVRILVDEGFVDQAKLYDISEQVESIAAHFPDMLIILAGEGESKFDIWEHRFKGDKKLKRETTMLPFLNDHQEFMTSSELEWEKHYREVMDRELERTREFLQTQDRHIEN